MVAPSFMLGLISISIITLVGYYCWITLMSYPGVTVKDWVDADFPELTHTPKPTWLTGFQYLSHGIPQVALLAQPIFIDYDTETELGRFSVVDQFARATDLMDGDSPTHDKDLVHYDFGLDLEIRPGGQVGITEIYKRISVTEITPIIEESACE